MKVGDYVRTPYGIRKIKSIPPHNKYQDDGFYVEDRFILCGREAMNEIITSPNIIDLIEVGDYVNGYKIVKIFVNKYNWKKLLIAMQREDEYEYSDYIEDYFCDDSIHIYNEDIKSILTKEQFERESYIVNEKNNDE